MFEADGCIPTDSRIQEHILEGITQQTFTTNGNRLNLDIDLLVNLFGDFSN